MKKGLTFIINLVIFVVGILFIALSRRDEGVHTITFITGVAFIVPAVINAISISRDGKKSKENPGGRSATARTMGLLTCGGAITLGLVMCFSPDSFRSLFIYIFAVALICGGLYHLYMIYKGLRPAPFPVWVIALPLLMLAGGISLLFIGSLHTGSGQSTAILLTGIGCILYAATTFIELIVCRAELRRRARLAANGTPFSGAGTSASDGNGSHRLVEDVDATEVK